MSELLTETGAVKTYPQGAKASYQRIDNRKVMYVAQLPGQDGVDWGWTTDPNAKLDPAIVLSPYWQRRFVRDMQHCNHKGIRLWPENSSKSDLTS